MHHNVSTALAVLRELGLPRAQLNARSAYVLLALASVSPDKSLADAQPTLIGITPIMDWVRDHYEMDYAPNTRETFRRQTMHQFVDAGIALYNPDKPDRPVNSPKAAYQLTAEALALLRLHGTSGWDVALRAFLGQRGSLVQRYARARSMEMIPITVGDGQALELSPGAHSQLIKDIIENFGPRFAPGSALIYAGDTGQKIGFFDREKLLGLGVAVDSHGKMPDVVLHFGDRNWLILIEAVTSHGPVDPKRHGELSRLFATSIAGLVYVTAFPDRLLMAKYVPEISWETEVWVADAPSHLIHFNGIRFLGPYSE